MRSEIKRLHQELGKTMIYVTHDQIEAMTLADRIVLLSDGRIEQAGRAARSVRAAAHPLRRRLSGLARDEFSARDPASWLDGAAGWRCAAARPLLPIPPRARDGLAARAGRRWSSACGPSTSPARTGPRAPAWRLIDVTIDLIQPTGSRTYATFRARPAPR